MVFLIKTTVQSRARAPSRRQGAGRQVGRCEWRSAARERLQRDPRTTFLPPASSGAGTAGGDVSAGTRRAEDGAEAPGEGSCSAPGAAPAAGRGCRLRAHGGGRRQGWAGSGGGSGLRARRGAAAAGHRLRGGRSSAERGAGRGGAERRGPRGGGCRALLPGTHSEGGAAGAAAAGASGSPSRRTARLQRGAGPGPAAVAGPRAGAASPAPSLEQVAASPCVQPGLEHCRG